MKNEKRHVIDKLKKNKFFMGVFILGLVVMLGSGVYAIWLISFQGTTGFIVDSTSPISLSNDFSISNINNTDSEVSKLEFVSFVNVDGDVNYGISVDTITDDVTSDNCNPSGDGSVSLTYDGVPVSDGDNITVSQGTTYFNVTTTLKARSCPQNFTTEVILTPQ